MPSCRLLQEWPRTVPHCTLEADVAQDSDGIHRECDCTVGSLIGLVTALSGAPVSALVSRRGILRPPWGAPRLQKAQGVNPE
jgi:hypothetical protein